MLKKTALAVMGLAASSYLFAGTMGPVCVPGHVTVPCETQFWEFGIQGLYLQSIYSGVDSVQLFQPVDNDWNLGFKAEGAYHFNTGSDIMIDWTHYSSDTNQTGFIGFIPVPPFISPFTLVNKNRLDQLDVVLGQHVDVGLVKKLRFYGGMQYAKLEVNKTNYYPSVFIRPLLTSSSIQLLDNTDFQGFGPVVGIDYSYNLTPALQVRANGSGSLLYGTSRYSADFVATAVGLVLLPTYNAAHTIVPTVQAKLGLNYEYNIPQGVIDFEGGYQAINYFNVMQAQVFQLPISPITTSNYGLYGPYFGVKFLGNV